MIFFTEHDIDRLIEDDVPMGDMTSLLLNFGSAQGSIALSARNPMVVCGTEEAERIYKKTGLDVLKVTPSGTFLEPGDTFLEARGKADALHLVWRTGSALLEYASGVATRTRTLLEKARPFNDRITVAGTRKHPPYLKKVALKALMAGGGVPHRTGLSDTILLFREHLAFTGGYESLAQLIPEIRSKQKERKIVVEAHTEDDALLAAQAGADAVQFDKLPPEAFAKAAVRCREINPGICIITAGGIKGDNAADYAKAGADVLVSSWMYFGPPADIRADIRKIDGQ